MVLPPQYYPNNPAANKAFADMQFKYSQQMKTPRAQGLDPEYYPNNPAANKKEDKKGGKRSKWMVHVRKTMRAHRGKSMKQVMKMAKKTYRGGPTRRR